MRVWPDGKTCKEKHAIELAALRASGLGALLDIQVAADGRFVGAAEQLLEALAAAMATRGEIDDFAARRIAEHAATAEAALERAEQAEAARASAERAAQLARVQLEQAQTARRNAERSAAAAEADKKSAARHAAAELIAAREDAARARAYSDARTQTLWDEQTRRQQAETGRLQAEEQARDLTAEVKQRNAQLLTATNALGAEQKAHAATHARAESNAHHAGRVGEQLATAIRELEAAQEQIARLADERDAARSEAERQRARAARGFGPVHRRARVVTRRARDGTDVAAREPGSEMPDAG